MIQEELLAGISFVIRVHNEEGNLSKSLQSLAGVVVPHEIVVVLHRCTDGSRAEAEAAMAAGQPVRIVTWEHPVSRAGLETLATPVNHPRSLPCYYNMCFGHARRFLWKFKWDADFVASEALLEWLNFGLPLHSSDPVRYSIPCMLGEDGPVNQEEYLYNCLQGFGKYMFWEIPCFSIPSRVVRIAHPIHSQPPSLLKEYWHRAPWFVGVDDALEANYAIVQEELGKDIPGMARASHPACDPFMHNAHRKVDALAARGIMLRE